MGAFSHSRSPYKIANQAKKRAAIEPPPDQQEANHNQAHGDPGCADKQPRLIPAKGF